MCYYCYSISVQLYLYARVQWHFSYQKRLIQQWAIWKCHTYVQDISQVRWRCCVLLSPIVSIVGANAARSHAGQSVHEQQATLNAFRVGTLRILCATTVAEEGLDVCQCTLIVLYNQSTTAIARVQRRGMALLLLIFCYKFQVEHVRQIVAAYCWHCQAVLSMRNWQVFVKRNCYVLLCNISMMVVRGIYERMYECYV